MAVCVNVFTLERLTHTYTHLNTRQERRRLTPDFPFSLSQLAIKFVRLCLQMWFPYLQVSVRLNET